MLGYYSYDGSMWGMVGQALSILSAACLFFGSSIELHSLEVGFFSMDTALRVWIHPTFVVWTDSPLPFKAESFAVGNVVLCQAKYRGTEYGERFLVPHEIKHTRQFRYLGPLLFWDDLARALNTEGVLSRQKTESLLSPPLNLEKLKKYWRARLDAMWLPPCQLPPLWNFWESSL